MKKNRIQIAAFSLIILFITAITAPLSARAEQYVTPHFVKEEKESVEKQEQRFYLIDISGAVTEYVYNAKGLLVEETDPLGAVTSYEYDAGDRLVKMVTPDGTVTEYSYTADGNVTKVIAKKADGTVDMLEYQYASNGSLTKAISDSAIDEYTYTEQGEIASVTRNGKYRLELAYNKAGRLINLKEVCCGVAVPDAETIYTYDNQNRLTKVVQNGTLLSQYRYNADGKLEQQTDGAGNVIRYTYDDKNNLTSMVTKSSNGIVLYQEENIYNENRSVTAKTVSGIVPETIGAAGSFFYTYDSSDRLIKEEGTYGVICYTYDNMGNRLTKTQNGVTTSYTYDLCNKLLTETTDGKITVYRYDAMGNLLKKTGPEGTTYYTYNAFHQLEKIINPYGICQENTYDAFGIRASLAENGKTTEYMTYNGMVLSGYNSAGERTEHYSYGDKILAQGIN